MFLLHESTRRSLCRLAFVALCAVPTIAVAVWAGSRHSAAYRATCTTALGDALGVAVTADAVEHPLPDTIRYSGLVIADASSDAILVQASTLLQHKSDAAATITCPRLTIEPGAGNYIAGLFQTALREHRHRQPALSLEIGELIMASPTGVVRLRNFRGRITSNGQNRIAELTFQTAEKGPVDVRIERFADGTTNLQIDAETASGDLNGSSAGGQFSPVWRLLRQIIIDRSVVVPQTDLARALVGLRESDRQTLPVD
jgi:hypothetical protein